MSTLIIMAAGIGKRYGGPKQIEGVGPSGEALLEYAIFDARRAGFRRVVIVIRPELEEEFDALAKRLSPLVPVICAPQSINQVPDSFDPGTRTRPWGTAHAVLAARGVVDSAFGVVNADDFYGTAAYSLAADACTEAEHTGLLTAIGFSLNAVLSDHGPVVRAVCQIADGRLTRLEEVREVQVAGDGIRGEFRGAPRHFTGEETVSMNFWVFPASIFKTLETRFERFLQEEGQDETSELLLPEVVDELIQEGRASVRVRKAPGPWFGLTHPDDRERVAHHLRALVAQGVYPDPLWDRATAR